jgi:hypothetical protein
VEILDNALKWMNKRRTKEKQRYQRKAAKLQSSLPELSSDLRTSDFL